ncbi:sugar phosphate isomerase/epimerase [Saccharomonospora azurea]|uniref:sugar phosphate isomerase/epimerase family protein n=1 Tax=Saccharomonospora azurea TaxID=40988 RepID=UPI0033260557
MGTEPGRRELALACLDYLDLEPADLVRVAADAGFDSVTLRAAGSVEECRGDLGRDAARVRRVRRALADTGLRVLDVEVLRLTPTLTHDEVARVVDLAAELGARHVLVVNSELDAEEATDRLGRIVERCAGTGVRPCLEPMPFSRCPTVAAAVSTAVPAGAAVLIDALHLQRSGGTPDDVASALAEHGADLVPYAQVCDAPARAPDPARPREEAVGQRLLPGQGQLPLAELLSVLPRDLPLAVEAPTRELARRSPADRAAAAIRAVRDVLSLD